MSSPIASDSDTVGLLRKRNVAGASPAPSPPASGLRRWAAAVKHVDLFPKAEEEVTYTTSGGLAVTAVTLCLIVLLFISELNHYLTTETTEHMVVDSMPGEDFRIHLNLTFPALRCSLCQLDVMDVSGHHQESVTNGLVFTPLDGFGTPLEPGIAGGVTAPGAVTPGVGCHIVGSVHVNKVAGNIHFAVGGTGRAHKGRRHVHKFQIEDLKAFNASHILHSLSFGQSYKGQRLPLTDVRSITTEGVAHFQYFIKVVPTTVESRVDDTRFDTNQYSVTERVTIVDPDRPTAAGGIPGLFLIYDFSPFRVRVLETARPFSSFVVSLCAIVGGVITVAGFVDSAIFHGRRAWERLTERPKALANLTQIASASAASAPSVVSPALSSTRSSPTALPVS